MTKFSDLMKNEIDVVTRKEFDKGLLSLIKKFNSFKDSTKGDFKIVNEVIEDNVGIFTHQITALSNRVSTLSFNLVRVERILREFMNKEDIKDGSYE